MSPFEKQLLAEVRSLKKGLDKLREEVRGERAADGLHAQGRRDGAVNRNTGAKLIGISTGKLDTLIRAGKIRTAEDSHLIPMAEIRRYCAPKVARVRAPVVGHRSRMKHIDGQSDEAIELAKKTIRERARLL